MTALGTIVEVYTGIDVASSVHRGILDYYDHWASIDPRLAKHYTQLSHAADVFGHDLVNMASYIDEILKCLPIRPASDRREVVLVGSMTEAFLVSVRSAYDALAIALSHVALTKPGQIPKGSLRSLFQWAQGHQNRIHPRVADYLLQAHSSFWKLRTLRDYVVHSGAHATIHFDGHQFNLWLHSPTKGWISREPLFPLLAQHFDDLLAFADSASVVINGIISMPVDRVGSRAVEGLMIGSLHRLRNIATNNHATV